MNLPPNHLQHSNSPYLLQHAYNPVEWYEWGDEALKKAKKENKLILISIGYAACHWCHVMAHQSFEDKNVAKIMNKHFVNIKVDREERPDIDQIYMLAAQLSTGHGGWPLNAFALPDGRPFYGGTYFPKEQWMNILQHMAEMYQTKTKDLIKAADSLAKGIAGSDIVNLNTATPSFTRSDLDKAFLSWLPHIDLEKGGNKGAQNQTPKFPMPDNWKFLMKYAELADNKDARMVVLKTLNGMALGGIYDHVGGGFTRYSTDQDWLIPHFEKMLYDNAQLIELYSKAYQWTKNELYKETVYRTIEWLEREMTSSEGAFYSSLDADSEGVEGKFYVWSFEELKEHGKKHWALLQKFYNITKEGNFEGKNNLNRSHTLAEFAKENGYSEIEVKNAIDEFNTLLLNKRSKRIRPGTDNKIITSWNAMTISGLVHAYRAFNEKRFLNIALKNADFLINNSIQKDGKLLRIVNQNKVKTGTGGFLDDFSFVAEAFIDLYMATFDEKWLNKANTLINYTLDHFFDQESRMFFYSSDIGEILIARKMEITDNVISSSNSSLAHALFKLGHLTNQQQYLEISKTMVNNIKNEVIANPRFFSNWACLYQDLISSPYEVAIVGKDWDQARIVIDNNFIPNMLLLGGVDEGSLELLKDKLIENQTTIYVCRNKICDLPTKEPGKAIEMMKAH